MMFKTVCFMGIALCALVGAAKAQTTMPGLPLVPLGYCQLGSLGSATALSSCNGSAGIPARANEAYICAETEGVRYRDDGVAPTATVGQPMGAGSCLFYAGTLSALLFIQESGSATLDVLFYRSP